MVGGADGDVLGGADGDVLGGADGDVFPCEWMSHG